MTGGTKPAKLNRVQHVSDVEHCLISVSSLCVDGYTVGFSKKNCAVTNNGSVIAIGDWAGVMYSVELQGSDGKIVITPEDKGKRLSVCHAQLAYSDKTASKRTMIIKEVAGSDQVEHQSARSCSPTVEGTVADTTLKLLATIDTQSGAMLHPDGAEMSVPSVGGACYFVTFSDEASGHVNAFHMKNKAETAKMLKRHAKWVEKQTKVKSRKAFLMMAGNTLRDVLS